MKYIITLYITLLFLLSFCTDEEKQNTKMEKQQPDTLSCADTIAFNFHFHNYLIDVVNIDSSIESLFSKPLYKRLEDSINLIPDHKTADRKIGRIIENFVQKYKVKNITLWYNDTNNRSRFIGFSFLFEYSKLKDYEIIFSLKGRDCIEVEKNCCDDDVMIRNPDLIQNTIVRMLNRDYQDMRQKLIQRK